MQIDWQKGLIPVVTQDENGEILMLAYMNEEAFKLSCQSGYAHYFSRSKNRIWKKGESSGNTQKIKQIKLDCDNDAILLKVEQIGAACHTGSHSCFFKELDILGSSKIPGENYRFFSKNSRIFSENSKIPSANTPSYGILDELYHTCLERKLSGDETTSYTAKLYKTAPNSYLKKIAEEACEFALAIKDFKAGSKGEHKETQPAYDIVYEGADVLFHILVALADVGIHPEQLLNELRRREGLSGLIEKANRKG